MLTKNGEWFDVPLPTKENTFVINAGRWIQIITNNHWLAAVHRVIKRSNKKRVSLAFFTGANRDTQIEPLKGCKVCNENEFEYPDLAGVRIGKYLDDLMNNAARKNADPTMSDIL